MASESGESARARLIKSRRGTEIDESLLSAARRECLDILREAARESEGEGLLEMLRGERKRLKDSPLSDLTYSWDRGGLMWGGLQALRKKLVKYQLPEEHEAWNLAYEASQSAGLWLQVACARTCVLWCGGLRRHTTALLGLGWQDLDLQASIRTHGSMQGMRPRVVVTGEE